MGKPLPKECTKADFARLIEVDPAMVSRWVGTGRLVMTDNGRVRVQPSLHRLLLTMDPSRGGRSGSAGIAGSGTIATIERLLTAAGDGSNEAALRLRIADLETELGSAADQLAAEQKFRADRCLLDDHVAQRLARLSDELQLRLAELVDAAARGQFDSFWDQLEGRIIWELGADDLAELAAEAAAGPPTQSPKPPTAPAEPAPVVVTFQNARAKREHFLALAAERDYKISTRELAPAVLLEQVLAGAGARIAALLDTIPGELRRRSPKLTSEDVAAVTAIVHKARNQAAALRLADVLGSDHDDAATAAPAAAELDG